MKLGDVIPVVKQSFQQWLDDRAPNEAAALAYYAMLSVPALLLLIQWILGRVVSESVQRQVIGFVQEAVQGQGSEAIAALIENADTPGSGGIATIVSLVTLAFSATGVVVNLEQSLNRIWRIVEEDGGVAGKILERLTSMAVVLLLGIFLLLSVVASTAVSGIAAQFAEFLPMSEWVLQLINMAISFLLLTILFGATLKIIPDAIIAWRDVWLGAAVTAVLFIVGQFALSLYLGKSAPGSAYGAAGSIVALVVWIYYSALILFFGAEFTQVYANRFGSRVRPDEDAMRLEEKLAQESPRLAHVAADDPSRSAPATSTASPVSTVERREQSDDLQYYFIGALALLIGVWRWLKR